MQVLSEKLFGASKNVYVRSLSQMGLFKREHRNQLPTGLFNREPQWTTHGLVQSRASQSATHGLVQSLDRNRPPTALFNRERRNQLPFSQSRTEAVPLGLKFMDGMTGQLFTN